MIDKIRKHLDFLLDTIQIVDIEQGLRLTIMTNCSIHVICNRKVYVLDKGVNTNDGNEFFNR